MTGRGSLPSRDHMTLCSPTPQVGKSSACSPIFLLDFCGGQGQGLIPYWEVDSLARDRAFQEQGWSCRGFKERRTPKLKGRWQHQEANWLLSLSALSETGAVWDGGGCPPQEDSQCQRPSESNEGGEPRGPIDPGKGSLLRGTSSDSARVAEIYDFGICPWGQGKMGQG